VSFISSVSMDGVLQKVVSMPYDTRARALVAAKDMSLVTISWEDTSRSKNSAWGPCICDFTLQVDGKAMPVIRSSTNFTDVTWDVPMDKVKLRVGNETGAALNMVTLDTYLKDAAQYIDPSCPSLHAGERDVNVIMSSQACFMPLPEDSDAHRDFYVAIYSYQSMAQHPAVLAIIATVNGTSAHIVTNDGSFSKPGSFGSTRYQLLSHNQNGKSHPLTIQLLKQYRKEKGQTENLDAPITDEEKLYNSVMVIQVPLKVPKRKSMGFGNGVFPEIAFIPSPVAFPKGATPFSFGPNPTHVREAAYSSEDMGFDLFGDGEIPQSADGDFPEDDEFDRPVATRGASTTRDGIVAIGREDGPFHALGLPAKKIERDPRFPIRVTFQDYKTTSNGVIDDMDVAMIASQRDEHRTKYCVPGSLSSLVTGGDTKRTTETKRVVPPWWELFLHQFPLRQKFSQTNAELAELVYGKHGLPLGTARNTVEALLRGLLTDVVSAPIEFGV
jgi:hypothetical protein